MLLAVYCLARFSTSHPKGQSRKENKYLLSGKIISARSKRASCPERGSTTGDLQAATPLGARELRAAQGCTAVAPPTSPHGARSRRPHINRPDPSQQLRPLIRRAPTVHRLPGPGRGRKRFSYPYSCRGKGHRNRARRTSGVKFANDDKSSPVLGFSSS